MSKRFRVGLSYSARQGTYVAGVADRLAERFGKEQVLFAPYHRREFARGDLGAILAPLYYEEVDLIVAVLSGEYNASEWCGLEWNALLAKLKAGRGKEVMLTRFGQSDHPSLMGLGGFLDLDEMSPDDAASEILARLALNEGYPPTHYLGAACSVEDWPVMPPATDWPVPDHKEALKAFAELISRSSPFRVLTIFGNSDTGKSYITKQFRRNALMMEGVRCGRLDFKVAAGMTVEVRGFAEALEVPVPAGADDLSTQLASILAHLKKTPKPTLLILDTFESAGDAEYWVRETLLLFAIRAVWLRVVVVGQRTPRPRGESWAGVCAPPIELRQPSAEDWFEYAQPRPDITLEFVSQAHRLCQGKVTVLAQLLTPSVDPA